MGFKRVAAHPHNVGKVAAALSKLTEQEEGLLHVLRDLQPIIVRASFSLVIGTFAAPSSPTAAGYAIGASMAFLTAFILLLARKVVYGIIRKKIEPDLPLVFAYGSIGLGLILLYLVPAEISSIIPSIHVYIGLANGVVYAVVGLVLADGAFEAFKRKQLQYPGRRIIRLLGVLSPFGVLLTSWSLALNSAIPSLSSDLTTWVLPTLGIAFTILALLALGYLERKWAGTAPHP